MQDTFIKAQNASRQAKSLRSERFKLQNGINNKKGLFYYSKIVYKFQISKRALI